jgi:toxin ParE1/3/4
MKVRIASAARADIDSIWLYTAQNSGTDIATALVEAFAGKFSLFAQFPGIGRPLDAGRMRDVRTFAIDRYVIFYRLAEGEIRILRVVHTSRDAFAVFRSEQD